MMRRTWLSLLVLLGIVLLGCAATAPSPLGTALPIAEVYTVPNGSPVSVVGEALNVDLHPAGWVNFDIRDDTSQVHVYWPRDGSDRSWLQDGVCVSVTGKYQVRNPNRKKDEPQIEADFVSASPEGCVSRTALSWEFISYGGVEYVAGSCHLVRTTTHGFLVDCGSYMNTDDMPVTARSEHVDEEGFPFGISGLQGVVITHAHADHIGRLHYLVYRGYEGPIYMTEATAEIYEATLSTLIYFSEIPVSKRNELEGQILGQVERRSYLEPFAICDGAIGMFVDAGHIPGSASVIISLDVGDETEVVTFSGDLGSGHHPFLNPPDTGTLSHTATTTLVIESTYGASGPRDYPEDDADLYKPFWQIIADAKEEGALVIIPTFALDRTQRVVDAILEGQRTLSDKGEPYVPELKLAIGGLSSCQLTHTYLDLLDNQDLCSRYFADDYCHDPALGSTELTYLRAGDEDCCCANEYNDVNYRAYDVIVTPSGTGSGSTENTTLSHELLMEFIGQSNAIIVKVGWAPYWSPMGDLSEENPPALITIDGDLIPVHAQIYEVHDVFSGHADVAGLVEYVRSFPELEQVIIMHGDDGDGRNPGAREGLEQALKDTSDWPNSIRILRPSEGVVVDLN